MCRVNVLEVEVVAVPVSCLYPFKHATRSCGGRKGASDGDGDGCGKAAAGRASFQDMASSKKYKCRGGLGDGDGMVGETVTC
jgi:hypothetical protein